MWQDFPPTVRPAAPRNDRIRSSFSLRGGSVVERIPRVLGIEVQERALTDGFQPHGLGGIRGGAYGGDGAAG